MHVTVVINDDDLATAKAEVMSWPPGTHASTFGGNPVSCAAALKTSVPGTCLVIGSSQANDFTSAT